MIKKPWKKILYENQGYADNYTDKTFLLELKKNIKYTEVSRFDAFLGASLLAQELCTVIIFVVLYFYLYVESLDPTNAFYTSSVLTLIGFIIHRKTSISKIRDTMGNDIRTVLIFLCFGHLFSPVLHTLTDTISTDTIYTMTFFMMLVHLIFFDYGISAAIVSNSLSLSAAIFASICLASRLASAYHAFVLLTIAVEVFVLFPLLRKKFKNILTTVTLLIITTYSVFLASTTITILTLILLLFVLIVCPLLFVKYQEYKDNIYGPWDEAIVEDADNISDLIYF